MDTSQRLARVHATLERLVREGSMVAEADGATHDGRPVALSPGEGEALCRWVQREGATRTVEVGLGYGVSALHVCEGLLRTGARDARHVVLDPFQADRFGSCGLQVLREAGVDARVEHRAVRSEIALPSFLEAGRRFDLAFVDGNHRFDGVFVDLFYLGRLVRKGGVILLDDYDLPGIRRAVSFFLANLGWRVEEESPPDDAHGWVALRTAACEDERDFRYFVDFA